MIILASNSPRRKQLLAFGGWSFQVHPVNIDEGVLIGEKPDDYVLRLSCEKAEAARLFLKDDAEDSDIIVSADTAVVFPVNMENQDAASLLPEFRHLDDETQHQFIILGKPRDEEHARKILQLLRKRTHQVYTGLTAMRIGDKLQHGVVCITDVPMRNYSDDEIEAYITSGDPFDKAGAYAIQHRGFHPARLLQGCYANVMGLPICHLAVLLKKFNTEKQLSIADKCLQAFDYACPVSEHILTYKNEEQFD
jgi:predicted house-cleaning NTP pyrophosphatase (Maf/HAM1 superfamily)